MVTRDPRVVGPLDAWRALLVRQTHELADTPERDLSDREVVERAFLTLSYEVLSEKEYLIIVFRKQTN